MFLAYSRINSFNVWYNRFFFTTKLVTQAKRIVRQWALSTEQWGMQFSNFTSTASFFPACWRRFTEFWEYFVRQTGVPHDRLERSGRLHAVRASALADLRDAQPVPAPHAGRAVQHLHVAGPHRQRYRISWPLRLCTFRHLKPFYGPIPTRTEFPSRTPMWSTKTVWYRNVFTVFSPSIPWLMAPLLFSRRCGHLDLRHVSFSRRFPSTRRTLKRKAGINRKIDVWQG